jgi:hypothetical protein
VLLYCEKRAEHASVVHERLCSIEGTLTTFALREKKPSVMPPRLANNAAPNRGSIHSAGAGDLTISMPTNLAYPEIKKYQALMIMMAQVDMRAQGDLSVTEQRTHLHDTMRSIVARWVASDSHLLAIPGVPACPLPFLQLPLPNGCTLATHVFNVLKCSTGTGTRVMNTIQLHVRSDAIKKEMMIQVANWNMLCYQPAGSPQFASPPSGRNRDQVYEQMVCLIAFECQHTLSYTAVTGCNGLARERDAQTPGASHFLPRRSVREFKFVL